jgi:predicted metal-dependent phosphoesterase TrpH
MIVDMHLHTMISSTCSLIDPDECITAALALGLDAICVTEHETLEGGRVMKELGKKSGLLVFAGMEVTSREGHILIYGYDKDIKGILPAAEIVRVVETAGGIAVPAHPWRRVFGWYTGPIERNLEETEFAKIFKVIEKYNGFNTAEQNKTADDFCAATGIFGTGGSDAHTVAQIGAAVTEFEDYFDNEKDLVSALRSGRFTARFNAEIAGTA